MAWTTPCRRMGAATFCRRSSIVGLMASNLHVQGATARRPASEAISANQIMESVALTLVLSRAVGRRLE
jgi:hypothetical protein